MNIAQEVIAAEQRIRPYIRNTILEYSPYYSKLTEGDVHFKLENLQHTGSFKLRGAMNKMLSISRAQQSRGVVTASTGNHGAAVAYGLGKLRSTGIVFVPENASPAKVQTIEQLGAEVRYFGDDTADTEAHARSFAKKNDLTYIPPYNDPQVIGGQGTIALEISRELKKIDAVFVALGGGGLISGIAAYLKSIHPQVKIIGCSPENSQVMIRSVAAGRIIELPSKPTISDGTAGGIEPGAVTFDLCRELIDDYETVTEDEIKESLKMFLQTQHMLIEGSAAVAVAAMVKRHHHLAGKNVVVIICGANISVEMLREVLRNK